MCGVKPWRNCALKGCFKDLIPNEYPLQIHVLLSSKCLNNYYKFIPPNKTLLRLFPSLGMESASGRESWKRQAWLSTILLLQTVCWPGTSPTMSVFPAGCPAQGSASVRLVLFCFCFSLCSSFIPSLISLVSLSAQGLSCLSQNGPHSPRALWPSRSSSQSSPRRTTAS